MGRHRKPDQVKRPAWRLAPFDAPTVAIRLPGPTLRARGAVVVGIVVCAGTASLGVAALAQPAVHTDVADVVTTGLFSAPAVVEPPVLTPELPVRHTASVTHLRRHIAPVVHVPAPAPAVAPVVDVQPAPTVKHESKHHHHESGDQS